MKDNGEYCLCGARLDENGRCPRLEFVIGEVLQNAMRRFVQIQNGGLPLKWGDKVKVTIASETVIDLMTR